MFMCWIHVLFSFSITLEHHVVNCPLALIDDGSSCGTFTHNTLFSSLSFCMGVKLPLTRQWQQLEVFSPQGLEIGLIARVNS